MHRPVIRRRLQRWRGCFPYSTSRIVLCGQAALCVLLFAGAVRFVGGAPAALSRALDTPAPVAGEPFPRIARDAYGHRLRLERPPDRLGSQSLVTDEFLFAIAPHDRIVAVSPVARDRRYSNVADLAAGMDLATADSPETIAASRPDLMLVSHTARADYVELTRSIGIPVFRMVTAFEGFQQIASALRVAGYLTGDDEAAEREVARLVERIRAARRRGRAARPAARILAFSNFANTLGAGSLFDRILTELGAVNVAAERGVGAQGTITSEHVAAWNPDWIVAGVEPAAAETTRARLLADPGVAVTTAGRQGQVLLVDNRTFLARSHHAVGLMEVLAEALNPGPT